MASNKNLQMRVNELNVIGLKLLADSVIDHFSRHQTLDRTALSVMLSIASVATRRTDLIEKEDLPF